MTVYLQNPLICIVVVLATTSFFTLMAPVEALLFIRLATLAASLAALIIGLIAGLSFDKGVTGFQFLTTLSTSTAYNFSFTLGADGFSMVFLLLTLFIFPVLFLAA